MNPSDVPFQVATSDQQERFSRKHRLDGDWRSLVSKGLVHSVYRVSDVVVKIPRHHPEWVSDTLTEAVAIPPVCAAGVPTPPLIAFDDDRDVFDVPVLVIGYADGRTIDPVVEVCPTCGLLGRALALLHTGVKVVPDLDGWLDHTASEGAEGHFLRAKERGVLSPAEIEFMETLFNTVSRVKSGLADTVFVHNDVHEGNVLFYEDGSLRLIDWGDAAWGDAAHDFTRVPPEWLLRVVEAYGSGGCVTPGLRSRIALNQTGNALRNLANSTVWAEEARSRLHRFSVVCGELLEIDIAVITA